MRASWHSLTYVLLSTSFVLLLTACGLSVSNPALFGATATAPVSIALTGPGTVMLGGRSQYAATVSGSSDHTVTWSVNSVAGGNASVGSITSAGLYTAPSSAPQTAQVTITATSVASPTISKSLPVALAAPPSTGESNGGGSPQITIVLNGAATVTLGTSSQYTATVSGASNTAVLWSVNGIPGGSAADGAISAGGLYAAPATAPQGSSVTITATSVADSTVSEGVTVTLTAAAASSGNGGGGTPPPVTVTLSGPTGVTLGKTAQYNAKVQNSSDTDVIWSVDGVAGGNSTDGTISNGGLYTAPTTEPSSSQVTIAATSVADSTVSRTLTVALNAPPSSGGGSSSPVTLALSGATTVALGASSQYSATVTGSTDKAVLWSVDGIVGGDAAVGLITTAGRYTAPAAEPQSSKVTIKAASQADPSVSQSLSVSLTTTTKPTGGSAVTVALSGPTGVTLGNRAQYVATVKGSTNTGVTWSVDGAEGGDASVGTLSANGLYSAPGAMPPSAKITITATSLADATVSQSLTITLAAPPQQTVSLTLSGPMTVALGTTAQYSATVSGSANTAVTWSVNGVAGGNATDGSISAGGLYTAPSTASQITTVTIAATSVADPAVAQSIVTALTAPSSCSSRIPTNAVVTGDLDASNNWVWVHDPGTPGSTQGTSNYPVAGVSADNVAREFYMTYATPGGELFHVSFAKDVNATHFVYDANVYVTDPSQLMNLEMDMNDVPADGTTMILGTQCSSISNSWEYTLISGGGPHWHPSNIPCSPLKWTGNAWHHIQIASHRESNGIASYDWVNVDGQCSDFQNANGYDLLSLGWAPGSLLINFQIDGEKKTGGSNKIYTDQVKVWRW